MKIESTPLKDLLLLHPAIYRDNRGHFFETYNKKQLSLMGLHVDFVQDNQSASGRGTFRGLHFQTKPKEQAKLVRCVLGEILDVVIDLRPNSATYRKCFSVKLSSENFLQLFVPRGFAHGFLVLSEMAVVSYKCDEFYSPEYESGVSVKDELVKVDWPIPPSDFILSERDSKWPRYM